MELLIQLIINGLVAGAQLSLMAIGFALIYGMTRLLHYAHGAAYQLAAYTFYVAASWLRLPFIVCVVFSFLSAILMGYAVQKYMYQPMQKNGASDTSVFMGSLGILIVVQYAVAIVFGLDNLPLTETAVGESLNFGFIVITPINLITFIAAVIILVAVVQFLKRTKTGKTMRAVAENKEMAMVVGVDVDKVVRQTFVLGSALVAPAAILLGLNKGITVTMGFDAMILIPISVIVGGIGSIPGAILGSFIIGLAQNVGLWKIAGVWQNTIAFVILLLVIVLKPTGLLGQRGKLSKKGV